MYCVFQPRCIKNDDIVTTLTLIFKNQSFSSFQNNNNNNIRKPLTWLKIGDPFLEATSHTLVVEDQIVNTRNYKKYILKDQIEDEKCRICHESQKTYNP